jgi:hypothetical protein
LEHDRGLPRVVTQAILDVKEFRSSHERGAVLKARLTSETFGTSLASLSFRQALDRSVVDLDAKVRDYGVEPACGTPVESTRAWVLGCGGWFPTDRRETTSILMRRGNRALLLDAGTGVRRLITDGGLLDGVTVIDIVLTPKAARPCNHSTAR